MSDAAGRSYFLRQTAASRVLTFMPVVMFVGGAVVGTVLLIVHGFVLPGAAVIPVWLAIAAFVARHYLGLAHTIEWSSDGTITFRSYIRRTVMRASEIRAIEPARSTIGILQIRHAGRKLLLLNQFDNFHEFLVRLKVENPRVEIRGC